MSRIAGILSFIILVPLYLEAQVIPRDESVLNYRLIGFSFPAEEKTINYTLEVAAGRYSSDDSFRKNIIKTLPCNTNKIIAEVPSFGSSYTWRVIYTFGRSSKTISAFFHFNTGTIPEADTTVTRLRIMQPASEFDEAYVFLDDSKTLYDMKGNPVWFLPDIKGTVITPRDLKLSPQGTVTFLFDQAYEINYNGDILWQAPNNGKVSGTEQEGYHHEFTRLHNGHYMVLGNEFLYCTRQPDSTFRIDNNENDKAERKGPDSRKQPFGTVIEYDEHDNVVWSWKSSNYFIASDLKYFIPPKGEYKIDLHENAFYFDEKNKNIYISFKNISRVIRVKYPEGVVSGIYGETFQPGSNTGNGLFCGQHACKLSQNGSLLLFNNNGCGTGIPRIEKVKETVTGHNNPGKNWEYECPLESGAPVAFQSGGNVIELSDQSIFASMGGIYSKLFIVDTGKEIIWSALPEKWNANEKKWRPLPLYRASIIENRKDLERLIWNTGKNDQIIVTATDPPIRPGVRGTQ